MSELFSDPQLDISEGGAQRFFTLQRWINMIFASSPFVNADHVLQAYNRNPDKTNLSDFHLDNTRSSLIKFCIFYLPESNVNVNLDAFMEFRSIVMRIALFCVAITTFLLVQNNHFLSVVRFYNGSLKN